MDTILIIDFGSQFSHLIARRIRDLGVFADVIADEDALQTVKDTPNVKGIILSGGAMSVYDDASPTIAQEVFSLDVPILGICYGHQLIAHILGGTVTGNDTAEYGPTQVTLDTENPLFKNVSAEEMVWMNHRDTVDAAPEGFAETARTANNKVAALSNTTQNIYSVQFHPEVTHTKAGMTILENFLTICEAKKEWTTDKLADDIIKEARETLGSKKAIIGLSGGIDSTVASFLVSSAIGSNLTAIYVDTGLMRQDETKNVRESFAEIDITLRIVDASEIFFAALAGVTDPEEKRKTIGKTFIDIFTEEAQKEQADVLIQGTIYSDRIESGGSKHASKIKSHHNVGGLPDDLALELYEPLRDLYKDEVRNLAKEIGVPDVIRSRQVFPGPGLAIRIIGEVTPEKVTIVRHAGHIIESELRDSEHWSRIWMSFAVLLSIKSVGVQGDERSYKYPIVLRIIESQDAMTANFSRIPYDLLDAISTRITNEVVQVNRVVYDITHKPPATMEWE